ncbi:MAG: alpha-amylase family glycosyl hydrolase [Cyanobium sp.]
MGAPLLRRQLAATLALFLGTALAPAAIAAKPAAGAGLASSRPATASAAGSSAASSSAAGAEPAPAAGLADPRVMLQGFYWESYRHGLPSGIGKRRWYEIVREKVGAIAAGGFDLVWLPPPSFAGERSAGYNPRQLFNLSSSYGDALQQRALLVALLRAGVEPVADIVINHRDGSAGWADFRNPAWGPWAVCRSDEAFSRRESGLTSTPAGERGACEESVPYRTGGTYNYPSFRDLNPRDPRVRADIIRHLLQLRSIGYRGWRYDMVHGYGARWIACYNAATQPTFSVGEYDWGAHAEQRGWIWHTSRRPELGGAAHLASASSVFDFLTYFSLKRAISGGQPASLRGFGHGVGLVGDHSDGLPWRTRAVTFVENHDTGYRTHDNGTPQEGHRFDSFANGPAVEQAYAQILSHPGVPTVYWKHYFEWGPRLQGTIRTLIQARKLAGVHAASMPAVRCAQPMG